MTVHAIPTGRVSIRRLTAYRDTPTACFYVALQVAPAEGAGATGTGVDAATGAELQGIAGQGGVEETGLEQAVKAAGHELDAFHRINSFRGVYMRL